MAKWYVSFRGLKPIDFMVLISLNIAVGAYVWKDYVNEMKAKNQKNPDAVKTSDQSESEKK